MAGQKGFDCKGFVPTQSGEMEGNMSDRMKRIGAATMMIAGFVAFAFSGCMPAAGGGIDSGAGETASGSALPMLLIVIIILAIILAVYFPIIKPRNKKIKELTERVRFLEEQAIRWSSSNQARRVCANCGAPLEDDAVFCVSCGQRG